MRTLSRRHLLAGVTALAGTAAVPAQGGEKPLLRRLELKVGPKSAPVREATVLLPSDKPDAPIPVIIFLHGFAEAKDKRRALRAWADDYGLIEAHRALRHPPVKAPSKRPAPLSTKRAADINAALKQRALAPVALVCPRTPVPYLVIPGKDMLAQYGAWLLEDLLPEVSRRCPLIAGARGRGLVGFSMGGRVALELLNRKPGAFHCFTGLQTELLQDQDRYYARRVAEAHGKQRALRVRIMTAFADPYRARNQTLGRELKRYGFPTEVDVLPGQHKARWMRRGASLEALFWQDRQLGPRKATNP